MAMEIRRVISGPGDSPAHDGQIMCIAYNPQRREIFTGSQDTTIKTWLSETGELVRTLTEHAGWVTGLAYAPELRVLFSCSIDGRILVWSKADLLQKEKVGSGKGDQAEISGGAAKGGPLYCLAWDARRHCLVAGANGHIWVYSAVSDLDINASTRNVIRLQTLLRDAHASRGAEDCMVRGIICTDSGKLFSVGYDRQLCMWDTDSLRGGATRKAKSKKGSGESYGEVAQLRKVGCRENCHDGAISAVTFDPDNNWVITGSFDRCVKIWAGDGKKVADIDAFPETITGLAYCPATKTLWMSANSASPQVYDPRSATDITPFLQQTDTAAQDEKLAKERIQRLFRIPQTGELLASTSTRNILIWRYNPFGACSILRAHSDWVEVLAHCYKKKPTPDGMEEGEEDSMILFSGGADSVIRRWEPASRMNPFIYSQTDTLAGHTGAVLCALYCESLDMFATGGDDGTIRLWPIQDIDPADELNNPKPAAASAAAGVSATPAGPCVFKEHTDRVTGLLCVGSTIGSVSWDLSIRLWDLNSALMKDEDPKSTHAIENAHDDYILSVAYSPELHQMASASADQGVKIWDMHEDIEPIEDIEGVTVPEGRKGKRCCGTLKGHAADVSHIKWNQVHSMWVSGSEDHSVRLWSKEGVQIGEIHPPGDAITALAVDAAGFVLVASMDRAVRVYDPIAIEVVQQHIGHSDAVRCILHVPEKEQYLTASWDRTVRVWRAYSGPGAISKEDAAGGESGDETATAAKATADGEADFAAGGEAAPDDGDRQPTYAELHPLIEPKWLADRKGGANEKFLKKVATEDGKDGKRKKKGADDEMAAKSVTGLSLKLNELEQSLKASLKIEDKPSSTQDRRGRQTLRTSRTGQPGKATGAGVKR